MTESDASTRGISSSLGRHGVTVLAMAAGAAIAIAGSLLPWVYSGTRARHSYDILALVDRLGFSPRGAVGELIRWWPLVPLVTLAGMVLAWWGWRRIGGVLGVVGGLYAASIGIAVAQAPAMVELGIGPVVTAGGGLVLLVASIVTLVVSGAGRTAPTDPVR